MGRYNTQQVDSPKLLPTDRSQPNKKEIQDISRNTRLSNKKNGILDIKTWEDTTPGEFTAPILVVVKLLGVGIVSTWLYSSGIMSTVLGLNA
ncbi:MAG: hypothetical protein AEth_01376 [Candidatus Argoarchaeum ethanivorans]|uniref:Uncharacterized protein n=1 Tax=Candidatus Argoarchaeum ethanivorans TaxID=2608793 RepID=A0A8B3S2L1_9EURY|nr:MAG: hypothetical protein AEth_01376 [Candidatus Argoarchaeum ethanivorans]